MDSLFKVSVRVNDNLLITDRFGDYKDDIVKREMIQKIAQDVILKKADIKITKLENQPFTEYSLELVVMTRTEFRKFVQDQIDTALSREASFKK